LNFKTQPQAAYLLHSRPYQEHKLLVELLTEYDGKVAAVVYNGKTAKSNKKPLLQPFLPLTVQIKGNGQLKTLQAIEAKDKSLSLLGSFLYCGFYINELLVKLLPELIPCHTLFEQYSRVLLELQQQKEPELILRNFELVLLEELGIGLDFTQVNACSSNLVSFCFDKGFIAADNLNLVLPKVDLLAMADKNFETMQVRKTAKQLMRHIINHLLGHKALNSRKLFEKEKKR